MDSIDHRNLLGRTIHVADSLITDLAEQFPDKLPRNKEADISFLRGQQSVIDYLIRLNSELQEK
jgi:hypothetical protein